MYILPGDADTYMAVAASHMEWLEACIILLIDFDNV